MAQGDGYTTGTLEVLRGLEAVRRRPGMYVGDTGDGTGLHNIVLNVVELALRQPRRGHEIMVRLHADGTIVVEDDGEGLSIDVEPREGKPHAELIFSTLYTPGREPAPILAATTALCETLRYEIRRDGLTHAQSFARGEPVTPMETHATPSAPPGTRVRLHPDATMFESMELSFARLADELRPRAHLAGMAITLTDEREDEPRHLRFHGDLTTWLRQMTRDASPLHPQPICIDERGEIGVVAALQWTDADDEHIHCFVNGEPACGGGTPVAALHEGRARVLPDATTRGLVALLAVVHRHPQFSDFHRATLTSRDAGAAVADAVARALERSIAAQPALAAAIRRRAPAARAALAGEALLVHADTLLAGGDPRGELIVLEHALSREDDPVRRDALDARAAALLDRERERIWDRPGGFPWRARWRGRSFIGYAGGEIVAIGDTGLRAYARVRAFLEELTDSGGPDAIESTARSLLDGRRALPGFPSVPERSTGQSWRWRRTGIVARALHDDIDPLVGAALDAGSELRLTYRFRWRHPGEPRILLPYQRRGWYAHGLGLMSALTLDVTRGGISLALQLPFESLADAGLLALRDRIVAQLGPIIDAGHFTIHAPAPFGRGMLATS